MHEHAQTETALGLLIVGRQGTIKTDKHQRGLPSAAQQAELDWMLDELRPIAQVALDVDRGRPKVLVQQRLQRGQRTGFARFARVGCRGVGRL